MVVIVFHINFGMETLIDPLKQVNNSFSRITLNYGVGALYLKFNLFLIFNHNILNFELKVKLSTKLGIISLDTFPYSPKLWYNKVIPLFSL